MPEGNVYNEHAPKLIERGFYPLVIGPGTKKPQHYVPSLSEFHDTAGWTHEARPPDTSPQPGAGVGLRCGKQPDGTYVVALDWDRDDAAIAAMETFPPGVAKEGARGFTTLYRSRRPIPTRPFKINGAMAVQVLSDGTQTVLPPSVHPDSKRPYVWTGRFTLYDVRPSDLPELPEDYLERIENILRPLGYDPEAEKPESYGHDPDAGENPYWDLNKLALRNLAAWIPDLGLYKCKRKRGPHASYEAVATWRPSTTGRSLEERESHLSISGAKGIKDFGTGEGFSPIDLVMRARNCSRSEAVAWLMERVQPDDGTVQVDFDAIADAPSIQPETPSEQPEPEHTENGDPVPPASLGEAWCFGDPVPAQEPMLVPNLIPRKGWGYLGGQWGTFKTFITNDLAVAIGSGGIFAGQQVTVTGAVVQIELEGSHCEMRLQAAAEVRGVANQKLPIVQLRVEPPKIMNSGVPNKEVWRKWSNDLATYAQAFAKARGVELGLITIDPQNSIAGFRDEQSSAEGQVVSDAWKSLSEKAGCFVLITDHFGKDPEAGLRGTSTKETNPGLILGTGATQKDVHARRQLTVRKMRNGASGQSVSFWMREREVTFDQVTLDGELIPRSAKTLIVEWGEGLRPVGVADEDDDTPTKQGRRALAVLGEMIGKGGEELPADCDAPTGLRGVKLESWRIRLIDKTVIEGKNQGAAFSQIKNSLLDLKAIDIGHGYVWIPLP